MLLKIFPNRTGAKAKILLFLVSDLIMSAHNLFLVLDATKKPIFLGSWVSGKAKRVAWCILTDSHPCRILIPKVMLIWLSWCGVLKLCSGSDFPGRERTQRKMGFFVISADLARAEYCTNLNLWKPASRE